MLKNKIKISIIIIGLLFFASSAFAISKAQFPNSSSLQPLPPDVKKGIIQNTDVNNNSSSPSPLQKLIASSPPVEINKGKSNSTIVVVLFIIFFIISVIFYIVKKKKKI